MRYGNASQQRRRKHRRYPRNNLGLHPELAHLQHLLATAPKNEGISNFEADYVFTGREAFPHPAVDLPLSLLRAARVLSRHAEFTRHLRLGSGGGQMGNIWGAGWKAGQCSYQPFT